MKRRVAFWVMLFCLFAACASASADTPRKKAGIVWHSVTMQGKTVRFPVFVPEMPDADIRLPLVLLAHRETGKAADRALKKHNWRDTANRAGFLIAGIGPECVTPGDFAAVLKAIGENYRVDTDNLYAVKTASAVPHWSALAPVFAARGIPSVTIEEGSRSDSRAIWHRLERLPQPTIAGATTKRLTIHIAGLRSDRGKVSLLLFRTADGFPNDSRKAAAQQTVSIENNSAVVVFEKLPRGEYAAVLLHDENSNGKLDTSFGFPLEGFGTSTNPRVRMGSPSFNDARFFLSGKGAARAIFIRVVYL